MRLRILADAFVKSVRNEGIGVATRKARRYLNQRRAINHGAASAGAYFSGAWHAMSNAGTFFPPAAPRTLFSTPRVALIGDLNLPQCRKYRVEQVVELCSSLGIEVSFSHYADVPRCFRILQDATHLIEYRVPLDEQCHRYRYEARRLQLPILYDIDDPLFSFSAYATYSNMKGVGTDLHSRFLTESVRYLAMMNGADILSVSTPELQHHLSRLTTRPVHVRRNFADQETLAAGSFAMRRVSRNTSDPFTISFASGSLGHEYDFAVAAEQIFQFMRHRTDAQLLIIGYFPESAIPEELRSKTTFKPFSDYDTYLSSIAESDCMIAPLTDEIFNRCKSAVRVIDASSVAVPSLASSVSDNACMVRDEVTGLLISDNATWYSALEKLYLNRTWTRQLGLAARSTLETEWVASDAPHIISPELVTWLRG